MTARSKEVESPKGKDTLDYPMVWRWRVRLPERFGQVCRVVARGAMNTVQVEFEDGFQVLTSGWAVRRRPTP